MNKRYFFNTLKALFLLLVSGGTACNSWLDVKPENEQPNDEFWNNKEEVDAVMMGAYQQPRTAGALGRTAWGRYDLGSRSDLEREHARGQGA